MRHECHIADAINLTPGEATRVLYVYVTKDPFPVLLLYRYRFVSVHQKVPLPLPLALLWCDKITIVSLALP